MPTYPLTFPAEFKVQSSRFELDRVSGITKSPFSRAQQVQNYTGRQWVGEVTSVPLRFEDSGSVRSFMGQLQGFTGTFLYGDPDYLAAGPQGSAGGTPLVNGASQTGTTLNIDGFPSSQTNVLRAGDYIQIGSGASSKLHMVVEDADSNGSGEVAAEIEPAILSAPADNTAITVTGAKGVFRMSGSPMITWQSNKYRIIQYTLSFQEAL